MLADAEALSGMPGAAGRLVGEEYSAFDGHVTARQIELVPASGSCGPGASRVRADTYAAIRPKQDAPS